MSIMGSITDIEFKISTYKTPKGKEYRVMEFRKEEVVSIDAYTGMITTDYTGWYQIPVYNADGLLEPQGVDNED